jgi:hypothetical protein
MRRTCVLLVVVCVVAAMPLFGGDCPRTEVFGSAGWGRWWDNQGSSLQGLNGSIGIGRRLLPQFAIEGEVAAFRGSRWYFGMESPYHSRGLLFTANAVLYVFRRERTEVFVLLGGGAARSTTKVEFPGVHYSQSGTGFVANAGTGVKVFLTKHLALRPEVRVLGTPAGSSLREPFSAELRFSIGLGYHW